MPTATRPRKHRMAIFPKLPCTAWEDGGQEGEARTLSAAERVQSACLKLRMEKQLPSNKQAQILRGHGEPDCQTPRGAIAALQGAKGIRARHLQRHPSQASVSLRGAQGHLCSTIPMGHAYQRPAGGLEGEQGRSKLTALGLEEGAQRSCLLLYAFEISHN